MSYKFGIVGCILATSISFGCSQSQYSAKDVSIADNWQASEVNNGVLLNGVKVNGVKVNGVKVNGVKVNGETLYVSSLANGVVSATSQDDASLTFSSSQLNGAIVDASLEDGSVMPFRIDSVVYSADAGTNLYYLSSWNGTSWDWACGSDPTGYYAPANTPIPSVALADTWNLVNGQNVSDPTLFTFGCVNAAIGKCVMFGYKRWTTQQECDANQNCKNQDLAFVHQACTRMVRGDYCGDGVPHTVTGTGIDVYDTFNIQTRTGVDGWSLEAEWRYDGAHCIHHTRWSKADPTSSYASDYDYVANVCPSRLATNDNTCADPSSSHFYTQYGFSDAIDARSFLRNESYQH